VCKLLRHISPTDSLHVQAKYGEINLKIYGPQVAVAARTLCSNHTSKIAKENLEVFVEMWASPMDDVQTLANEIADVCRAKAQDKQVYTSLPRPGVRSVSITINQYYFIYDLSTLNCNRTGPFITFLNGLFGRGYLRA